MKFKALLIVILSIFITDSSYGQLSDTALIDNLTNYLHKKNIPGAMISIVKSDSIIFMGGIGLANIEKQEKVTQKHLFRLGSISKSFTALGMLKLLNEKKLPLNSPIKKIDSDIPFRNIWSEKTPITIEHLLEHTSGFDDFHFSSVYNRKDTAPPSARQEVSSHQQSLISKWEPGTRKAYSNSGYVVAGHLIEVLSQVPFANYLKKEILMPLHMPASGFYFKEPQNKHMAQGYRFDGIQNNPVSFASINGAAAGGFSSNAEEMANFLQFMLTKKAMALDSLLFTEELFNRIEYSKTTLAAKNGLVHGYGLGNYSIWKNGFLFHGHSGGIDGFSSRYLYSRKADLGIAVSINREGDANAVANEILNFIIGEQLSPPNNRLTYPIPVALKQNYSGYYAFRSSNQKLLSLTDKMLAGRALDFKENEIIIRSVFGKALDTLYYAGDNKFYRDSEGTPSVILFENNKGEPILGFNDNYFEKESRGLRIILFSAFLLSFLMLILFLIYGSIFFIKRIFLKQKNPLLDVLILWSSCACIPLLFIGFGLSASNRETMGMVNFSSILVYTSSLLAVVLTLISVVWVFKLHKEKALNSFYIATTISLLILVGFLWDSGFIGLRIWAY